jgi:hypothetical protein
VSIVPSFSSDVQTAKIGGEKADDAAYAAAIQSDGKIVAAGSSKEAGGLNRVTLV